MDNQRFRGLAVGQAGVISRTQALALGMSERQVDHRVAAGDWIRVFPEVYRLATVAPTAEQQVRAASLWLEDGVLTAAGAAWWWDLMPEPPLQWDFLVPGTGSRVRPPQVRLQRRWVDPSDVTVHRDVAVIARPLTVLRAAVDLERARRSQGIRLIDRAKQQRLVSSADLQSTFRRNRGTWGTTTMRELLERTGDRAHSELERLAVTLLRQAGITGFTVNLRLKLSGGRPVELDIAFEDRRLALELDGFAYHSAPDAHAADLQRQNALIADGWTVLRFTYADLVSDPDGFIRTVSEALT
jgi:very-short-patch-repair endonuclease